MRKRLLLFLVCLVSVLLAGYVTLRLTAPPKHRITWDNICAIKKGMTQEEVESILGVPAGVYSSRPRVGLYPEQVFDNCSGKEWAIGSKTVTYDFARLMEGA